MIKHNTQDPLCRGIEIGVHAVIEDLQEATARAKERVPADSIVLSLMNSLCATLTTGADALITENYFAHKTVEALEDEGKDDE